MGIKTVSGAAKEHREQFGRCLRQLREAGEHSREWLAGELGVDPQTVMRLEAGKAPVELHLIAAARTALGCGVAPLIASVLNREELVDEVESQLLESAEFVQARAQVEILARQVSALVPAAAALQTRMGAVARGWDGSVPSPFLDIATFNHSGAP